VRPTSGGGGQLSPSRIKRTRIILLAEVVFAVVLGVLVHPLLFAFLLLPIAELAVKPAAQRQQILGLGGR
jgi:hypothetical protein